MPLTEVALQGRHVRLEPLRHEHAHELWTSANDPEVWAYMGHVVRTKDDLESWIHKRIEDRAHGTALPFLQRDARTSAAFGSTSLFDVDLEHRRMEIGHTWLGRTHRRTAANTEAKLLLLTHAFETLGANRVQFKTDNRNLRSQAAIARLGAVREGVLRSHMIMPDGHLRDSVYFSIIRPEWPSVRRRLEELLAVPRPNPGRPG